MKSQASDSKGKLSEEDAENVTEAANAAAQELFAQIAETFGISVEDLQSLMEDMNLDMTDLLDQEDLSSLLLEAGGAVDSLSLLTNEQLYTDYQALMEQGRQLVDQVSGELGITPEELAGVLEEPEEDGIQPEDLTGMSDVLAGQDLNRPEENQAIQNGRNEEQNSGTGSRHKSEAKNEGEGNLVLQTIKETQFDYQMETVQSASGRADVDTQDVIRQIMDYMRVQFKPEVSSVEMQLHPASLGTLQIQIEAKGGVLTANFITQNEAVKSALESQMVQLQENFEQQGIKVEAIEVMVGTHEFEQNLDEQGREGGQSGEPGEGKRPRTRRIDMNGLDGTMPLEEMEEEDRIAAEMMAANGGSVDYTA